jgi:hypothetical protein
MNSSPIIPKFTFRNEKQSTLMNTSIYLILILLVFSACKTDLTGDLIPNQAPETFTVVDTIIRPSDDRLESQVDIQWWGNDPDGHIIGYEYTFDDLITSNTVWSFTEKQDSIFLLQTPPGQDTADFRFSVRAIDNRGLTDLTPANAGYPVKNSNPSVVIIPGTNAPELSFPVVRYFWQGDDPDGEANLSHYELYWNDTSNTPYIVDVTVNSAIFEANSPTTSGVQESKIYLNNNETEESTTIPGMIVGGYNQLYVRSVDQSDAKSGYGRTDSIYIKKVQSSTLLVNAYSGGGDPILDFYANSLITQGITTFDTTTLFSLSEPPQVAADNLTQEKIFGLFDLIVWFGNNAQSSLSLAQKTSTEFFDKGGKLFMSVYVSSSFDQQSDFLDFTPIAELVDPTDTTLLLEIGSVISPADAGWPTLESTTIVGVVRPIILQIGSEPIYSGGITARDDATFTLQPWTGDDVVMGRKRDAMGNTNFIISTLEVHKLDGMATLDALFEKIIVDEFGL